MLIQDVFFSGTVSLIIDNLIILTNAYLDT